MKKLRAYIGGTVFFDITDEQYEDIQEDGIDPDEVIDNFWKKIYECTEVEWSIVDG